MVASNKQTKKTMVKKKDLKIAIVGGSDIGKALSTALVSCGYDVEMVCKEEHKTIKIDNSYVFEIDGDFGKKSFLVPYVTDIEKLSNKKDIIIFATKSHRTVSLASKAVNHLTPKGMIVTMQNVFIVDQLFRLIPDEISVCMVCDFTCKSFNKVTYIKDTNGVTLGSYNKSAINRMKLVGKIFSQFTSVKYTNDIVGFSLGRNIINGAISILGGISGLRLREIMDDRNGRYLFCKIIEESIRLTDKYRIKVVPYNYQLDYYKFVEKSISGWFYRYDIMKMLKKQNRHVKSSTLHSIENKERIEITILLENILHRAKKVRVDMRYLSALYNILKDIESGRRNIDENVFYDPVLVGLSKKIKEKEK